jgi:hypothetical protein
MSIGSTTPLSGDVTSIDLANLTEDASVVVHTEDLGKITISNAKGRETNITSITGMNLQCDTLDGRERIDCFSGRPTISRYLQRNRPMRLNGVLTEPIISITLQVKARA